jgi:hypothetical protein
MTHYELRGPPAWICVASQVIIISSRFVEIVISAPFILSSNLLMILIHKRNPLKDRKLKLATHD